MSCTCLSFPDRMCGCHLPGDPHKECTCVCEPDSPTRGGGELAPANWLPEDWPFDDDEDDPPVGTCQVCGHYTADRYCYATDRCKEVGGADVL